MLRLTSDCYYLSKEKIEDVSSTFLFSLVVEYPYYQEGILIRKLWGNQFTYTFLTLSLPSSGVCERESFPCPFPSFLLTVSAQRLYRWVLSLTSFCSSGCTAASGRWYRHHALQQLGRWFRPYTAQVPLSPLV